MSYPAYGVSAPSVQIEELEFQKKALKADHVEVDITHNGICHSDVHMLKNEWSVHGCNSQYPLVPGHEAIGIVTQVGETVTHLKVGDRVGFGPQRNSCQSCENCDKGDEQLCQNHNEGLYSPETGGFGSTIIAPSRFAFKIPDAIPSQYAGPLMCAGVTVFSPLTRSGLKKGDKVAIVGVGGLGHLAVQYAKALGYEVTAITRSLDKADMIKSFGASSIIDSTNPEDMTKNKNSFNFILNTVSAAINVDAYLALLKPWGRLTFVGLGDKNIEVNPFSVVMSNKQIAGSGIGGVADMNAMLEFSAEHQIFPTIEVVETPFGTGCADKVTAAVAKVVDNTARFRMVLDYKK